MTQKRSRRSLSRALPANCDPNANLLSKAEAVAWSTSLAEVPALALGTNLQLTEVACTLAETLNATSTLMLLLQEEQHLNREATLENRAAIDYWLLRAKYGCEDFKGRCCFGLTDDNKPIEAQLKNFKTLVQNIRQDLKGIEWWNWLSHLFPSITPILKQFVSLVLTILGVLLVLGITFCCFAQVWSTCPAQMHGCKYYTAPT